MRVLAVLLWVAALAWGRSHRCPSPLPAPCTCSKSGAQIGVICERVASRESFSEVLRSLSNYTVDALVLRRCHELSIWPRDFRKLHVREVVLENSHLRMLALYGSFRGLELSLRRLNLVNSTVADFAVDDGRQFSRLRRLRIVQSPVLPRDVGPNLTANFPRFLRDITISKCGIRAVQARAFAKFSFLETLDLSGNDLETFNRSWLPDSAQDLQEINLAKNKILAEQLGSFSNLPGLEVVRLSRNNITRLEARVLRPVWGQLLELHLDENPLHCDCHLKWIVDSPQLSDQQLHLPACLSPTRLRSSQIPEATRKLFC